MGLSIGQLGALTCESRKHDITYQQQRLSEDKLALTRDMQKVTRAYQQALSSKKMKWSLNNGITCSDISYATLMRPNPLNAKSPVMISNQSGKILIDQNYKKYAEMISPDGSAGGDYASHRDEILSQLVGVTKEQMIADADTAADLYDKRAALSEAEKAMNSVAHKSYDPESFIKKFLNSSSFGGSNVEITKDNVDEYASKVKAELAGKDYFSAEVYEQFNIACDAAKESVISDANLEKEEQRVEKRSLDEFIALIVGVFRGNNDNITVWADNKGNGTRTQYENAKAAYDAAQKECDAAASAHGAVFTAEQETKIKYYDLLFQSIVDNGWVYDVAIEDSNYLTQQLENNYYYITTIEEETTYTPHSSEVIGATYSYDTTVASNYDNIFMVNDSDAADDALVEYEHKKYVIKEKEEKIDLKMKRLQTELEAITKMMEGDKKTSEDNIERTFKVFA